MPVSTYMPDVKVEVAFNAGYDTPEASRVWTDVSQWVELDETLGIDRGRSDEFATTDPNKLELIVDNSDGRFTPKRAASPYFPNVKIGRPIRVTSTPVGGSTSTRFVGFVEQWPIEWSTGVATTARSKVVAYSRMARLGIGNELEPQPLAVARTHGVDHAFALTAPAGSRTVADSVELGRTLAVSSAGVSFEGGSDSVTGATFAGNGSIWGPMPLNPLTSFTLAATVLLNQTSAGDQSILEAISLTSQWRFALALEPGTGRLRIESEAPGYIMWGFGPKITDNQPHHLVLVVEPDGSGEGGTQLVGYVDGVLVDTVIVFFLPTEAPPDRLRIGNTLTGTVADVQVFMEPLSDAAIEDLAAASLTGNAGETAAERLERIRSTVTSIPASSVDFDPATGPVQRTEFAGRNVLDVMRDVEAAERGVLYDARDGRLVYAGRASRYNRATELTLDVNLQEVEAGLSPTFDRQRLVNDATITGASGTPWRYVSAASVADYGPAAVSETLALDDLTAEALSQWLVNLGCEPDVRIPALTFDLLPLSPPRQAAALALDIGSRIVLTNLPGQAHTASLPLFVEGITETIGAESYRLELNVSPAVPFDVFTLDHPQHGQLDSTYPLAL